MTALAALGSGLALALWVGAAAARATDSATVSLSSNRAGVSPVALAITLRTELQCGRVPARMVSLRLPAQERVPASIPPAAVSVGGVRAARVDVLEHTLRIVLPRRRGMTCLSIVFGPARIAVSRTAGLGNPSGSGTYALVVSAGKVTAVARFTIRV